MFCLKLEDETVLRFDFEKNYYEVLHPELLPLTLRDALSDTTKVSDLNVWFRNKELMSSFFLNRSISVKRENAKYIMNQMGIAQGNDFESRFKAMVKCRAMSAADSYWLTENEDEKWNDANLLSGDLNGALQQIALFGSSVKIAGRIQTPELTGQGAYAKAWYKENGSLYLYKANSKDGNECEREVLASDILDCFNVPHVKYELTQKEGRTVCKCRNMNLENSSIVDSIELDIWCARKKIDFLEKARKIDSEMLYKTIVADYLISNSDRHGANWGFYMNNQTGKIICAHPLFDHNNAFDKNFMEDENGGICQLSHGKSQREAALYAIKRCDFRCTKPVSKSMFFDEEMYESFMERAVELGLYREQKISLADKIFSKGKERFVPIELKNDNTQEYWDKVRENLFCAVESKNIEKENQIKNIERKVPQNSSDVKRTKHRKYNDKDGWSISD